MGLVGGAEEAGEAVLEDVTEFDVHGDAALQPSPPSIPFLLGAVSDWANLGELAGALWPGGLPIGGVPGPQFDGAPLPVPPQLSSCRLTGAQRI